MASPRSTTRRTAPADQRPDSLVINAEVLRFLLRYEPETGLFFWRHRRSGVASDQPAGKRKGEYVVIRVLNRFYLAQRLAWLYVHGHWPTKLVDHIDRDPRNNRIANLREADFQENAWNSSAQKPGVTGFVGVTFNRRRGAFEASLHVNGRKKYLGLFSTAEEANQHRLDVARRMRGQFFPGE